MGDYKLLFAAVVLVSVALLCVFLTGDAIIDWSRVPAEGLNEYVVSTRVTDPLDAAHLSVFNWGDFERGSAILSTFKPASANELVVAQKIANFIDENGVRERTDIIKNMKVLTDFRGDIEAARANLN